MLFIPLLAFAGTPNSSHVKRSDPQSELAQTYRYPEWFRDAKFGIWAHWGPQSVPGQGDWFARRLYEQGDADYEYHLAHFGHPSKTGYKDIIPLWKAEKWDPDRLMGLYKKAGARYFVSMGVHHDNFDLWNSHYHRWNAVNMGPHRDVVGTWQTAAKKLGLKFGVSEHLGASFTWFQDSHGSDKTGPFAGIPYDGSDPANYDLYHQPAKPGDTGWYSTDPTWQSEWKQRIYDLIDNYHPDLLYSDGGVPFENEVGFGMINHFYGSGKNVVYTCKQPSNGAWVEDFERGVMKGISPYPFQTDTSIGDWFYNVNWKFRDIRWVVHTLVDDVSKNGNLLLNVVQHPDGSLDPEVENLLAHMAEWTSVNGEGIYGSRPWVTFGEGKVKARGGSFGEDFAYSGDDIRFTTRGGYLYAYCLGWPTGGTVTISSLAPSGTGGKVSSVKLLGSSAKLTWSQDQSGLHVSLPSQPISEVAIGLKIKASNLFGFQPAEPTAPPTSEDSNQVFILGTDHVDLHGNAVQTEHQGDHDNVGFWDSPQDWISWQIKVDRPGTYKIDFMAASPAGSPSVTVSLPGENLSVVIPHTESFTDFQPVSAGRVSFDKAGVYQFSIHPVEAGWHPINLADLKLSRVSN